MGVNRFTKTNRFTKIAVNLPRCFAFAVVCVADRSKYGRALPFWTRMQWGRWTGKCNQAFGFGRLGSHSHVRISPQLWLVKPVWCKEQSSQMTKTRSKTKHFRRRKAKDGKKSSVFAGYKQGRAKWKGMYIISTQQFVQKVETRRIKTSISGAFIFLVYLF